MILDYHRPKNIEEAIALLSRKSIPTKPLAGGGNISQNKQDNFEVVDLQLLGLRYISRNKDKTIIGATVTLQELMESEYIQSPMKSALAQSASINKRYTATIAGSIFAGLGNNPFLTCLVALDAEMIWLPEETVIGIGSWLIEKRRPEGVLVKEIRFTSNVSIRYAGVGRTPADSPFICVARAEWPSGRVRIALGLPQMPYPAMVVDGRGAEGAETALKNACSQYTINKYTINTSITLINRLNEEVQG